METIALYMRLSSEDARSGESESITNQRDLLYHFIRSRREFDCCKILEFCDDGYSGMNFCRPDVQKMLSLAGKRVNCIIVKDFSRFGRNLIEVGDYLDQIFPSLGVRFITVNEGYDSRERGGSIGLEVSLKAMIYEMYSRDISDKIRSVQRSKMQRGEYLGGIAFYGYQRSQTVKNHLEIDKNVASVVRQIFHMAADGITPSRIATVLNQEHIPSPLMYRRRHHTDGMRGWRTAGDITYWTRDSVRRIISDERYTGCLIGCKRMVTDLPSKRTQLVPKEKWIVVEDTQEAIVSKEIFAQAQMVLRKMTHNRVLSKPNQKFRGLIKCAYCGRTLERIACREAYYLCPTAKTFPDYICKSISLKEYRLEQILTTIMQKYIQLSCVSYIEENNMDDLYKKIKNCQMAISRYKTLQIIAFEQYAEKQIDKQEYLVQKNRAAVQQKEATEQLEEWNKRLEELWEKQKKTERERKKEVLKNGLTREFLTEFLQTILVKESGNLEIFWKIADCN